MSKTESEDPNQITHRVVMAPGQAVDGFTVEKSDNTVVFKVDKDGLITEPLGTVGRGSSFTIYISGVNYCCKNGTTGAVTSSTAAHTIINAALTAANAAGGGTVTLRAGTYSIISRIIMKTNTRLVGEEKHTTILIAGAVCSIGIISIMEVTDLEVNNLTIDANHPTIDGTQGIFIRRSTGLTFRNLIVKNTNDATDVNGIFGYTLAATSPAIADVLVENCTFDTMGYCAIYIRSDIATPMTDITVRNCKFMNCAVTGIGAGVVYVGNAHRVTIDGNHFLPRVGSEQGRGIYISGSSDVCVSHNVIDDTGCGGQRAAGIYFLYVENSTIIGNTLVNASDLSYMAMIDVNYSNHIGIIGNNVISNEVTTYLIDGIVCEPACTNVSILGNTIYSDGTNANASVAIYPHGTATPGTMDCQDIAICNNSIKGWNLAMAPTYTERLTIIGNVIDCPSGIYIAATDHACVVGNSILTTIAGQGIWESGVDCHYNYYMGNDLYNSTAPAIATTGPGHQVMYNRGWITENQGTSTGTGAQQTIAHGLSETPTHVLLSESTTGAALPYQSAVADATNIYVTAVLNKTWQWEAKVR